MRRRGEFLRRGERAPCCADPADLRLCTTSGSEWILARYGMGLSSLRGTANAKPWRLLSGFPFHAGRREELLVVRSLGIGNEAVSPDCAP